MPKNIWVCKLVEECLDGVIIKELRMNHPVNEAFISYLGCIEDFQSILPSFSTSVFQNNLRGALSSRTLRATPLARYLYRFSEEMELHLKKKISQFVLEGERSSELL